MGRVINWLEEFFLALVIRNAGTDVQVRSALNLIGFNLTDNAEDDSTDVDMTTIPGDGTNVTVSCAQTTWGIPTSGIVAKELTAPIVTVDGTPALLLSFPIPADTGADFVITVVGRWAGGSSGTAGDMYRADFPVTYQRIGSAGPTTVGGAAAETNKKSNGGGSAYAGSVDVSGLNVHVSGTGAANTTVHWTAVIQGQQIG